jgi:pyruvate formate lyase activating enzyme
MMDNVIDNGARGTVFNIQFFNLHDGPGTRTLVFLKGCPLSCKWCSNPESMSRLPDLGINRSMCDICGKCIDVCPEEALFFNEDNALNVDRQKCNACGECVSSCSHEVLTIYGKEMTAQEVFEEVIKDKMFYEGTDGGVTISGGEPLMQPDFLTAVFKLCRAAGIHTCMETTGYTGTKLFEQVLPLTDHILFDLKHMDSHLHQEFTGKTNRQILDNAELAAGSGIPLMFRMPIVPGFNDNMQNIEATAYFVRSLKGDNVQGIELMPYHRMGMGKYESLDKQYALNAVKPSEPDYVELISKKFEELGVICTVSR